MIYATETLRPETNAMFYGLTIKLYGNSKAFLFKDVAICFKNQMRLGSKRTGVVVLFFTIETTHVHILVMIPSSKALTKFVQIVLTSFSKKVKYLLDKENKPYIAKGSRVYETGVMATPIYTMEQFLTLVCYQYHNSDSMREKSGEREYWNSSASEYDKGQLTPQNDPLLLILGMTWKQLHEVLDMDRDHRKEWIFRWSKRFDEKKSRMILRIDPDKPFTEAAGMTDAKENAMELLRKRL